MTWFVTRLFKLVPWLVTFLSWLATCLSCLCTRLVTCLCWLVTQHVTRLSRLVTRIVTCLYWRVNWIVTWLSWIVIRHVTRLSRLVTRFVTCLYWLVNCCQDLRLPCDLQINDLAPEQTTRWLIHWLHFGKLHLFPVIYTVLNLEIVHIYSHICWDCRCAHSDKIKLMLNSGWDSYFSAIWR